jgi:hypothetical protein
MFFGTFASLRTPLWVRFSIRDYLLSSRIATYLRSKCISAEDSFAGGHGVTACRRNGVSVLQTSPLKARIAPTEDYWLGTLDLSSFVPPVASPCRSFRIAGTPYLEERRRRLLPRRHALNRYTPLPRARRCRDRQSQFPDRFVGREVLSGRSQ